MILRGLGSLGLGFFFVDFLVDFNMVEAFGVFMVGLRREMKECLWRVNVSDDL